MSEEEFEAIAESHIKKVGVLVKSMQLLVIGAFILGGWVATLELRQRTQETLLTSTSKLALDLEKKAIAVDKTRWTLANQQAYMQSDAENRRLVELRLQRLEDQSQRLHAEMVGIQRDIDTKLTITPGDVMSELKRLFKEHTP